MEKVYCNTVEGFEEIPEYQTMVEKAKRLTLAEREKLEWLDALLQSEFARTGEHTDRYRRYDVYCVGIDPCTDENGKRFFTAKIQRAKDHGWLDDYGWHDWLLWRQTK